MKTRMFKSNDKVSSVGGGAAGDPRKWSSTWKVTEGERQGVQVEGEALPRPLQSQVITTHLPPGLSYPWPHRCPQTSLSQPPALCVFRMAQRTGSSHQRELCKPSSHG